ncbi:MAG: amino acid adenylation domain-containing protein [Spirochaetales bacterium]|nr:amino acid adenylation domain-containing protein [Spirochaetales bacterium]
MIYYPIQQQFNLAYELNHDNCAYNMPSLLKLAGTLDRDIFQKTLEILIPRHFDKKYFPPIFQEKDFSFEEAKTIINTPFKLGEGEYYKVYVWQDMKEAYILFLFHHINFDLRSKEIWADEFGKVYQNLLLGEEPQLAPTVEYKQYNFWYNEFSQSDKYKKMLSYWEKEALEKSLLDLPADRERQPIPSSRGHRIYGTLPSELTVRLKEYCESNNSDPFLVLLSAYAVFLNRFSGQDDFNIGIPRSNRPPGFEDTLGCFVNILPLCLTMAEDMTFEQLLRQVRMKMLGMHRNQYIPYLDVVKLNQTRRDTKYNPLFQAGFTSEHPMRLKLNGVESTALDIAPDAAQLDLFFYFWREGEDFRWAVEYCTDLFTQERVESFVAAFQKILLNGLEEPSHPVDTLSVMDEVSEKKIARWNSTKKDYLFPGGIHQYFLQQVQENPRQKALSFRDEDMSYEELYQKAAALAVTLKERGVNRETIVGLSLERSFEMIIGMYAITLAGGTYLPIEPSLPKDYIDYILEDSGTQIILSKSDYSGLFPSSLDFIDLVDFDYSQQLTENHLPTIDPDDRVYILYTSGSTGRPKGVEITHRGLINRILWMDDEYKLIPGDVLFQKTPYNFDVSGWEFWWPLMKGVPLVIAEPEGHKDNDYLIKTIESHKITLIHFVPSMLREFLKSCQKGDCPSLRDVVCSGEALPAAVVRDFYEALPQARLHNLYGPTEASIDVTYWPCPADCPLVPIGRPIANTQIHILDEALNPLPPGVTGEIYLAGTGLARGYLNKPKLTAERFVPNPFDGTRMYKTGDLGQWNLEGEILYLGRNDSQIQLHGLRIELGEIENILNDHPHVEATAVIVHGDFGADQYLLAYVVKKGETDSQDIISFLSQHLPLHMVPKRIIFVEELKLNSNGKLDRKSLPAPDSLGQVEEASYISPEGAGEEVVATLWRKILNLEKISRDANFFELGGSSLHIVQMQRVLGQKMNRKIPITDLFSHTTVKDLAAYLFAEENAEENEMEEAKLNQRAARSRQAAQRMKKVRKK